MRANLIKLSNDNSTVSGDTFSKSTNFDRSKRISLNFFLDSFVISLLLLKIIFPHPAVLILSIEEWICFTW